MCNIKRSLFALIRYCDTQLVTQGAKLSAEEQAYPNESAMGMNFFMIVFTFEQCYVRVACCRVAGLRTAVRIRLPRLFLENCLVPCQRTAWHNMMLLHMRSALYTARGNLRRRVTPGRSLSSQFSGVDDGQFSQAADRGKPAFRLSPRFVQQYESKPAPFGFNGLGELVYHRSYARTKGDSDQKEQWFETVERVVNGTYNMQKRWIEQHELGWTPSRAQRSAQEMYDRIFNMKFLPPGRGLWAMGSPLTEEKMLYAALNNCAFVSTADLKYNPSQPFAFLMDAAMLGVGVGFDTRGAGSIVIKGCNLSKPAELFTIPDSREGWVDSLRILLEAHILGRAVPQFDYSLVRPAGEPIRVRAALAAGWGGALHERPPLLYVLHT